MEELLKMINMNFVFLDGAGQSNLQIIKRLAEGLKNEGFVSSDYTKSLIEREISYPTGLPSMTHGTAIPHTDSKHVLKEAIVIALLKNPVNFKRMDDPEKDVKVSIIFLLALNNPENQLKALQGITAIIQNETILQKIVTTRDKTELINILSTVNSKS